MQTNPVGYEDQMNLYAYVRNDPLNNMDPTGMGTYSYAGKDDDDKAAENAFHARAVDTAGKENASQWGNGDELVGALEGSVNITEANVFSHGWDAGLIGANGAGNEGLYDVAVEGDPATAAYASDVAAGVASGSIEWLKGPQSIYSRADQIR